MCGIVGICSNSSVVASLYDSLINLQHRGQDAAGIVTCDKKFHRACGFGLVRDVFKKADITRLTGNMGIGHVRYPTAGNTHNIEEVQPFTLNTPYGMAFAHNGNIINQEALANKVCREYKRHLNTASDSEIIFNLFAAGIDIAHARDKNSAIFTQICQATKLLHDNIAGSYSIVATIINQGLVAIRDPYGIRPLVYSKKSNDQGGYDYIFASEPTMFYSLGFTEIYNVKPGEVLFVDMQGELHKKTIEPKQFSPCFFEYVYFARPDSTLDDVGVYRARLRMGENLAKQWQQKYPEIIPDVVIPAPSTSNTAALSFAGTLGVRYSEGLYKNPFIGRTFIMSNAKDRKKSVRYKLCPQPFEIQNKNVLILDDSIVRGTTSKEIVDMVRKCGAKKVYFVTTCPPVKFPCFYGMDIPTRAELIAAHETEAEIEAHLGVDKLLYQRIEDVVEAITRKGEHHIVKPCLACLTGKYLHKVDDGTMSAIEGQRTKQREGK